MESVPFGIRFRRIQDRLPGIGPANPAPPPEMPAKCHPNHAKNRLFRTSCPLPSSQTIFRIHLKNKAFPPLFSAFLHLRFFAALAQFSRKTLHFYPEPFSLRLDQVKSTSSRRERENSPGRSEAEPWECAPPHAPAPEGRPNPTATAKSNPIKKQPHQNPNKPHPPRPNNTNHLR